MVMVAPKIDCATTQTQVKWRKKSVRTTASQNKRVFREMTDMASRASSLTQIFKSERVSRWLKTYGLGVAMGVFLALVGAVQTAEVVFWPRLFYWVSSMLIGTLIAHICAKLLDRLNGLSLWQEMLTLFVMITVLISIFVWAYTALYFGYGFKVSNLRLFVVPVSVISLAMTGLHFMADQIPHQSHVAVAAPATRAEIKLKARLDSRFKEANILAVSSEDHYLRVYTDRGEALILMRLYDAINALEGIEGSQVHRSWWLARNAVDATIRLDGRPAFRLKNGQTVPISRTFIKALKTDGWL
jgi:DNA-binding LytR/AlgR family response regulator